VPPFSSLFLVLLEHYGLQLQHLSPHSIMLVVIFTHFCEMFVGVRPSVCLFRWFHVLHSVNRQPPRLGGYYFQHRMKGSSKYLAALSSDRWERWREDWVLVQADTHERLTLPIVVATPPALTESRTRPRTSLQPCAGQDLDPGRERAHTHDGATRLRVKAHRAPPGAYPPGMALHRGGSSIKKKYHVKELYLRGRRSVVGDGMTTWFWTDDWALLLQRPGSYTSSFASRRATPRQVFGNRYAWIHLESGAPTPLLVPCRRVRRAIADTEASDAIDTHSARAISHFLGVSGGHVQNSRYHAAVINQNNQLHQRSSSRQGVCSTPLV
jgi:hypothetical protein